MILKQLRTSSYLGHTTQLLESLGDFLSPHSGTLHIFDGEIWFQETMTSSAIHANANIYSDISAFHLIPLLQIKRCGHGLQADHPGIFVYCFKRL